MGGPMPRVWAMEYVDGKNRNGLGSLWNRARSVDGFFLTGETFVGLVRVAGDPSSRGFV